MISAEADLGVLRCPGDCSGAVWPDPWHPIADTSKAIAGLCQELGLSVEIRSDTDPAGWADLAGVELLVVNSGAGMPDQPLQPDPV